MKTVENCSTALPIADTDRMLDVNEIRRRRGKKKVAELARVAGLTRQRWYELERGERVDIRISTLEAIAHALGCKPAELLKLK